MPQLCTFGASSARGFGLTEETGPGLPDDQFNLTTLLLPGNGTNGAQNNTFLDSSTNNLTITRNGNTTQGTFSPFSFGGGTAQADGYYSGYFDGTGDCVSFTPISALNPGTGDFTLELWVYHQTTSTYQGYYYGGASGCINFRRTNSNTIELSHDGVQSVLITSSTVPSNQWAHVAVTRSSGTVRIFINGVIGGSVSYTGNFSSSGGTGTIGSITTSVYNLTGYISNFRLIIGTALYTANFTVPITPLTAIANTSLLTCQSSQFIDNSTNALAITSVGNSQPVPTNPFGMTDWSGYFDGTGDYLNVPANAAFAFGTGDFTVEAWVYPTTRNATYGSQIVGPHVYGVSADWLFMINTTGNLYFQISGVTTGAQTSTSIVQLNTWTHVVVVRNSGNVTFYINGVAAGTGSYTTSITNAATALGIGAASNGSAASTLTGSISNLRIVKGTAVYTANFTPPTAPLTAISGTSLLTCQSSTFVDNSTNAFTITVNGNAYTGTLNNPFNSPVNYTTPPLQAWSNYFDGTGDYLSVASNAAFGVGSGDFTIECWIYLTQNFDATGQGVVTASYNTNFAVIGTNSGAGNRIDVYVANSTLSTGTNYISLNTWTHLAVVRLSGTTRIYFNGVQVASSGSLTGTGAAAALYVGTLSHDLNQEMTGYISNVRLVKGTAVYTAAFTPPTAPLTATANTSLLTCQSNRFVDNSINRFAITRNGDTSVQAFSPFNPDAPYSTTSVGGSAYFDGSGDYLTYSPSTSNQFGTGSFTVEAWYYPLSTPTGVAAAYIYDARTASVLSTWILGCRLNGTGVGNLLGWFNGSAVLEGSALTVNAWNHVVYVRNSGTNTGSLFLNGTRTATQTDTTNYSSTGATANIGSRYNNTDFLNGYLQDLRIVKGTAVYDASATSIIIPTAPLTAITNTSLLTNFTNAGIPDATAKQVLETVGNAQISTAQSKFGGSSMAFDGTGDYLKSRLNDPIVFLGSGNWTIEGWVYLNTTSGTQTFITGQSDYATPANASYGLYVAGSSAGDFFYGSSFVSLGAPGLSATTWTHCAWVRNGSNINFYRNGTNITGVSIGANSINNGTTNPLCIGGANNSANPLNGYIDDLRITKGYARYTTNFTPPTQAFPLF